DSSIGPAFDRGLKHGLESDALTHDLFAARTLALTGELEAIDVEPWLSGLLIGSEIRAGLQWSRVANSAVTIRIIGEASLSHRYAHALRAAGAAPDCGPNDAAARGVRRIRT